MKHAVWCATLSWFGEEQGECDCRNVTEEKDDPERFHLFRLCHCTTCHATGKDLRAPMGSPIRCEHCRGEGRTRELVATATDPESLGVALVTLGREGEWKDCPIGILDTEGATGEKWLVRPWLPSARNVSDAGKMLRGARRDV